MNQLSNAIVVIERISVSPKESLKSKKDYALAKKHRPRVYVHRYCPKCKTIKKDDHQIHFKKCCRKCKTTMVYSCSKCKLRFLRNLACMRRHEEKCRPNGNTYILQIHIHWIVLHVHCKVEFQTTIRFFIAAPIVKKYDSADFLVKKNKIGIFFFPRRYLNSTYKIVNKKEDFNVFFQIFPKISLAIVQAAKWALQIAKNPRKWNVKSAKASCSINAINVESYTTIMMHYCIIQKACAILIFTSATNVISQIQRGKESIDTFWTYTAG